MPQTASRKRAMARARVSTRSRALPPGVLCAFFILTLVPPRVYCGGNAGEKSAEPTSEETDDSGSNLPFPSTPPRELPTQLESSSDSVGPELSVSLKKLWSGLKEGSSKDYFEYGGWSEKGLSEFFSEASDESLKRYESLSSKQFYSLEEVRLTMNVKRLRTSMVKYIQNFWGKLTEPQCPAQPAEAKFKVIRPGPLRLPLKGYLLDTADIAEFEKFRECLRVDRVFYGRRVSKWGRKIESIPEEKREIELMECSPQEIQQMPEVFIADMTPFSKRVMGDPKYRKEMWVGHEGPGKVLEVGGFTDRHLAESRFMKIAFNQLSINADTKPFRYRVGGASKQATPTISSPETITSPPPQQSDKSQPVIEVDQSDYPPEYGCDEEGFECITDSFVLVDEIAKDHNINSYYLTQLAFGIAGRTVAIPQRTFDRINMWPKDRRLLDLPGSALLQLQTSQDKYFTPLYHGEIVFEVTPKTPDSTPSDLTDTTPPETPNVREETKNRLSTGGRDDSLSDWKVIDDNADTSPTSSLLDDAPSAPRATSREKFDFTLQAYVGTGFAGFYHKFYRAPNWLGCKRMDPRNGADAVTLLKLTLITSEIMSSIAALQEYPNHGYFSVGSCADLPALVMAAFYGQPPRKDLVAIPPFFPLMTTAPARLEMQKYLKCRIMNPTPQGLTTCRSELTLGTKSKRDKSAVFQYQEEAASFDQRSVTYMEALSNFKRSKQTAEDAADLNMNMGWDGLKTTRGFTKGFSSVEALLAASERCVLMLKLIEALKNHPSELDDTSQLSFLSRPGRVAASIPWTIDSTETNVPKPDCLTCKTPLPETADQYHLWRGAFNPFEISHIDDRSPQSRLLRKRTPWKQPNSITLKKHPRTGEDIAEQKYIKDALKCPFEHIRNELTRFVDSAALPENMNLFGQNNNQYCLPNMDGTERFD